MRAPPNQQAHEVGCSSGRQATYDKPIQELLNRVLDRTDVMVVAPLTGEAHALVDNHDPALWVSVEPTDAGPESDTGSKVRKFHLTVYKVTGSSSNVDVATIDVDFYRDGQEKLFTVGILNVLE